MPHIPNLPPPAPAITKSAPTSPPQVLVIGGLALDTTITPTSPVALHTSNPARITSTPGGVAHNLHLALTRSSIRSHLITALGTDPAGTTLASLLPGTSTLLPSPLPSAQYISLNTPTGSLYTAAADMSIISSTLTPAALTPILSTHSSTPYILADANIPAATLHHIISHCRTTGQKFIFEPTSTAKTPRILPQKTSAPLPLLHAAAPNSFELTTLWETAKERGWFDTPAWFKLIDELQLGADFRERINNLRLPPCITDEGLVQKAIQCLPLCDNLWVKLGGDGCLITRVLRTRGEWEVACEEDGVAWWGQGVGVHVVWYKAEVPEEVVSVNGAGDTFLGVLVAGEVRGMRLGERVRTAQRAAVETLRVVGSVGDVGRVWRE